MYVDTHCHLFKRYYKNIDDTIKECGSNIIIVSGIDGSTNKEVIKLCEKYKNVYGTLGLHPNSVFDCSFADLKYIEENINHPKIIGLGEMGLDYYRSTNKEEQEDIFLKQLNLAIKYNKPVVIHSRDSFEDTYNILKLEEYSNLKIVMHCYSYGLDEAYKFVDLGLKLGIGGIITFKNAKILKEVVKNIDLRHIVLETDSPFLCPERGKQNKPSYIPFIAEEIANIKDMDTKEVIRITTENALSQFDLK